MNCLEGKCPYFQECSNFDKRYVDNDYDRYNKKCYGFNFYQCSQYMQIAESKNSEIHFWTISVPAKTFSALREYQKAGWFSKEIKGLYLSTLYVYEKGGDFFEYFTKQKMSLTKQTDYGKRAYYAYLGVENSDFSVTLLRTQNYLENINNCSLCSASYFSYSINQLVAEVGESKIRSVITETFEKCRNSWSEKQKQEKSTANSKDLKEREEKEALEKLTRYIER